MLILDIAADYRDSDVVSVGSDHWRPSVSASWSVIVSASAAVRNAHAWFETNSGWAPPDSGTIAEWMADGVCRCPDECLVAPDAWCEHGLASWWLILNAEAIEPGAIRPASGGPARGGRP